MRKYYCFFLLVLASFTGCEKESYNVYVVNVEADVAGPELLTLDVHQGNAAVVVTTNPYKQVVTTPDDESFHATVTYSNAASSKPIKISVSDNSGNILATQTGTGTVDVQIP